jgi:hypothetical protein
MAGSVLRKYLGHSASSASIVLRQRDDPRLRNADMLRHRAVEWRRPDEVDVGAQIAVTLEAPCASSVKTNRSGKSPNAFRTRRSTARDLGA